MTLTLQDVAYLLGLPIAGQAVGPRVVPQTWKDDLEGRFFQVQRMDGLDEVNPHPQRAYGPARSWFLQFQVRNVMYPCHKYLTLCTLLILMDFFFHVQSTYLAPDADDYSVDRSLEVYLLWLFGNTMFNNTHGASVDKVLGVYAQEIADAALGQVPQYSWGSAVLAATYRGLCDACQKTDEGAVLTGCPLLLQLWSYERIAIGRPIVDQSPYGADMYGDVLAEGPTMGSLWATREVHI